MKRLLRYRVLFITAFFLLFGIAASLLAKADELKLSFLLLSPLLALAVSGLLLFLLRGKMGRRLSPVLRPVGIASFVIALFALIFYVNLFSRNTFKFLHGDGSITHHVKGDKTCYSSEALECKKENPGISDDDVIALCFTNPANKTWVWSEDCIKKNLIWLIAGYAVAVIFVSSFFSFLAEYFAQKQARKKALFPAAITDDGKTCVFISYSHADSAVALKLKSMLEEEGIAVIIDSESMLAGEDIGAFIYRAIAASHVTLAVVSEQSLLSSWVALETVATFFLQRFSNAKHFVACVQGKELYDTNFVANLAGRVDAKLAEVEAAIENQKRLRVDTRNLNADKSRLMFLRNNIDEIINGLKNTLTVDVGDDGLATNFPLLLRSIKNYALMAEAEEEV